jgi:hypothetical protein
LLVSRNQEDRVIVIFQMQGDGELCMRFYVWSKGDLEFCHL